MISASRSRRRHSRLAAWWRPALVVAFMLAAGGLLRAVPVGRASPAPAATPQPIAPDIRFGAVQALDAPGRATQAGVRWERLPFNWAAIQPGGPLDWNDPYASRVLTDESSRG